jgi:hypothetical protein
MAIFSNLGSRAKSAWNAFFFNKDPTQSYDYGSSYSLRQTHLYSYRRDKSIVPAILTRFSVDCAAVDIKHVILDEDGRLKGVKNSYLNDCLTVEANVDQTGRSFIQDVVYSMLDEGVVAVVPVDTEGDPINSDSYDVLTLRVGRVTQWYPLHVKVELYDERNGLKREIVLPKKMVTLIENPFYSTMNETNSIMQRLMRKLALLDMLDEKNGSGKLDLIISFPHIINTERRKVQAETRRASIESQLVNSKYGIAYTDGTEHITQLNRPIDNNLQSRVEYLTTLLFAQLGITQAVLDGSANDSEMLNYRNRIIEPILAAVTGEMNRKFLSKNARTRGETIKYFPNAFNMVTVSQISEIATALISARVMTANEGRQLLGLKPSSEQGADTLSNPNIDKMVDAKQLNDKNPGESNTTNQSSNAEVNNQNEET